MVFRMKALWLVAMFLAGLVSLPLTNVLLSVYREPEAIIKNGGQSLPLVKYRRWKYSR